MRNISKASPALYDFMLIRILRIRSFSFAQCHIVSLADERIRKKDAEA